MNQLQRSLDTYLQVLDNKNVQFGIIAFLALYAKMASKSLPSKMKDMLSVPLYCDIYTVVMLALILYTTTKNMTISILLVLCYVLTLSTLHKCQCERSIENLHNQHEEVVNVLQQTVLPNQPMHEQAPAPVNEEQQMLNDDFNNNELVELEQDNISSCSNTHDYRNKFYPQYVDSENHQVARNEQETISGFDTTKSFANL